MSEANEGKGVGRPAFWKRRAFWVGGGLLALVGAVAVATPRAWARGFPGHSEEQKQQAKRIAERAIDQAGPLAAKHREHREAMVRELAKPEIDRDALERLRREEMALADEASKLAVGAVADLGDVLTPEQRADLVAFAHRFHAEGRGR